MKPLFAALCAVLMLGACTSREQQEKAFGDKVHAYLVTHPEVLNEMQDAYAIRAVAAEQTRVQSKIGPLHDAIFNDPRDPSIGPKNAKVTVVEFFDYRCPHCKEIYQDYLAVIKSHPDVRFVFKEMPIFGPDSRNAAAAALVANEQGKYLDVYRDLMADHDVDAAAVSKVLANNGLDAKRTEIAAADPKIADQLAAVSRLAINLGVSGTPAFIVNDGYVVGANLPELTKMIEAKRKG